MVGAIVAVAAPTGFAASGVLDVGGPPPSLAHTVSLIQRELGYYNI